MRALNVDDLDATPDASYFAFGSDAGEVILLGRTGDTVATLFTTNGLPRIDAIEIGSDSPLHSLLVGGDNFINLYLAQQQNYLTVKTDPSGIGTIPGEGWYGQGQTVSLTAPINLGSYRLITMPFSWDVDGTPQGVANPINVVMDAPHTVTAHYTDPSIGGEWAPITLQALSPINTLQLLAQWIALTLVAAASAIAAYRRFLKKRW